MTPEEPIDPKGVMIGDVEGRPEAVEPSRRRGEPTEIEVVLQYLDDTDADTQSERYRRLKDYQEFAGEASFGNLMGGKPHLRENPQDYWPVDSHVVPVAFGDEIFEARSFWGLIVDVDDSDTVIVDEPGGRTGYATGQNGDYDGRPERSPNHYRLEISIAPIANLDDYDDREAVLAEYSPVLNQM